MNIQAFRTKAIPILTFDDLGTNNFKHFKYTLSKNYIIFCNLMIKSPSPPPTKMHSAEKLIFQEKDQEGLEGVLNDVSKKYIPLESVN